MTTVNTMIITAGGETVPAVVNAKRTGRYGICIRRQGERYETDAKDREIILKVLTAMISSDFFCTVPGIDITVSDCGENRFPKYSGIIPANPDGVLCIDKSLLIGVLKRASVFSNTATDTIALKFKDGQLNVCADDPAYGMRCDETLLCDYKGPELSVMVKDYLLIEVLNSLQTDRIEIGVSEGLKPIRIRPEEPEQEEESQVAVLMPSTR